MRSRWMILLGVFLLFPTAATGWSAARHAGRSASEHHALLTAGSSALLLFVVFIWMACSDRFRERLHFLLLLLLLGGVVAICYSSWEAREAPAETIRLDPLDLHVLLASCVLAMSAIALGLSFRSSSYSGAELVVEPAGAKLDYATAIVPTAPRHRIAYQRVPAGRFWILVMLLGLAAAGLGVYTLALATQAWTARGLYEQVVQLDDHRRVQITRRLLHATTASAFVILPMFLAILARWSPRRRVILSLLALLGAGLLASTLLSGALIAVDSAEGPVLRLNPSTRPTTSTKPASAPASTYPTDY